MQKSICLGLLAMILSVTSLNASFKDGKIFVGASVGYLPFNYDFNGAYGQGTQPGAGDKVSGKASGGGALIGLRAGYIFYQKGRFSSRAYANVDISKLSGDYSNYQGRAGTNFTKTTQDIDILHFSANVDAMFDIIASDSMLFGVYAGLGVGETLYKIKNNYSANDIGGIKNDVRDGTNVLLNAGFRMAFTTNHSIEIGATLGGRLNDKEYEDDYIPGIGDYTNSLTHDNHKINWLNTKVSYLYTF